MPNFRHRCFDVGFLYPRPRTNFGTPCTRASNIDDPCLHTSKMSTHYSEHQTCSTGFGEVNVAALATLLYPKCWIATTSGIAERQEKIIQYIRNYDGTQNNNIAPGGGFHHDSRGA